MTTSTLTRPVTRSSRAEFGRTRPSTTGRWSVPYGVNLGSCSAKYDDSYTDISLLHLKLGVWHKTRKQKLPVAGDKSAVDVRSSQMLAVGLLKTYDNIIIIFYNGCRCLWETVISALAFICMVNRLKVRAVGNFYCFIKPLVLLFLLQFGQ